MAATDQPVVNDPPSPQHRSAMTFRPPLNDQARARRAGGTLLVLTRQALNAMETNREFQIRAYIATRLVDEARTVLSRLRNLDIGRDQGFCLIATRARERIAHIRSLISAMHDASAELELIRVELAALTGDLVAARSGIESLML